MSLEESMNQSVNRLRAELMDRIEALELRVTSLEAVQTSPDIPAEDNPAHVPGDEAHADNENGQST